MAVTPVTLLPALSAWNSAGLSHLLLGCPVSDMQAHFLKETAAVPRMAAVDKPSMPVVVAEKASVGRSAVGSESSGLTGNSSGAFTENNPTRPAPSPVVKSSRVVPLELWPEPWQKAFAKASPAPLLWSYHSLGLDMEGGPDSKQRSTLLRRVIGQLNLPRGSSVFWPCAIPAAQNSDGRESGTAPDIFFSGVALLKPQLLILFGNQAAEDIGITSIPACFSQTLVDGKLLVLLPDLEQLGSDASVNSVVSFMRAALAAISFSNV